MTASEDDSQSDMGDLNSHDGTAKHHIGTEAPAGTQEDSPDGHRHTSSAEPARVHEKGSAGQLPENPETWTIEHVNSWALRSELHASTAESLLENEINGHWLIRLKQEYIREMIPRVGPRMAFCQAHDGLCDSMRQQDSSSSPSVSTVASTGDDDSGTVSQLHGNTDSSPTTQSRACSDSDPVRMDLHRRCGIALAKISESSTVLDSSDEEVFRDIEHVYGDGLCNIKDWSNVDGNFNILRVAVLAIRPEGATLPHHAGRGGPGPTLATLYTQWVDFIVSRTSYDAYIREYPEMGECLAQLASFITDSSFPVTVFSSEELMLESLARFMDRHGVSSVHIGIVDAYAHRLWQREGAANIGTFPPSLFAVKAMIGSKNDKWFSLTSACPLRPVFNAARQCGIVPPTEILAVLRCPAGPAACCLHNRVDNAIVVREQNMLVYLAERDQAHDRDSGAIEVDSLTEPLVRNYEKETGTWPLTIVEKVNLVKTLITNPQITVTPRQISFGSTVSVSTRTMLLKIITKFPDLRIEALSDDGSSDQIQVNPIGEHVENSRSGSMATTFTPDPYAHFSGWVDCPWESGAYYIRQMEPRMTCHHNQRTGEVTCSDTRGFLAIVVGTEALRKLELCEEDDMEVLCTATEESKLLPVHCTFKGENPRYTLKYKHTGAALPDPQYVDMSPAFFATNVVQMKPKLHNNNMQSAGPEVSPSVPPGSARADTIHNAVTGDAADAADAATSIGETVDDSIEPDTTRRESSLVDTRPLKLRRKFDNDHSPSPGQPEAPGLLSGPIPKQQPSPLPASVGLPQQQEIQVATADDDDADDVCDQCGLDHDIKGDRLYLCEARAPSGGKCVRVTHLKCMGLQKAPTWAVCGAHSEEFYTVRTYYRKMMQVATAGPRPKHTVTSWCRKMRTQIMETCGYAIGETTVRDFLSFDPGEKFKPHNEQGSLKTNLTFNTYFQKRAHNSSVERGDNP